jgi:hypothetical protein
VNYFTAVGTSRLAESSQRGLEVVPGDSGDRRDVCIFCKRGHVVIGDETVDFRQHSDRGWVQVRATIRVGRCASCGMIKMTEAAEANLERAFREAYLRLPPA